MAYLLHESEFVHFFPSEILTYIRHDAVLNVKGYIQRGFSINTIDINFKNLLHFAVLYDARNIANFFINAGININAKNTDGMTPLHNAVRYNLDKMAKILIDAGADINIEDKEGKFASDYVNETNKEMVKLLPHIEFPEFLTEAEEKISSDQFFDAAIDNSVDIIKEYIKQGGDVNIRNPHSSQTSLMYATMDINLEIMKLLIDAGADVDVKTDNGSTALMYACANDSADAVKMLIDAGANTGIKNLNGYDAFYFAEKFGKSDKDMILRLLTPIEFPEFLTEDWKKGYK
jgi:ankyrin repeat protein